MTGCQGPHVFTKKSDERITLLLGVPLFAFKQCDTLGIRMINLAPSQTTLLPEVHQDHLILLGGAQDTRQIILSIVRFS